MLDFLTLDLGLSRLLVRGLVVEREVVPDRVSLEGGCVILASVRSVLQASQQRYVEGFTRVQISQAQLVYGTSGGFAVRATVGDEKCFESSDDFPLPSSCLPAGFSLLGGI